MEFKRRTKEINDIKGIATSGSIDFFSEGISRKSFNMGPEAISFTGKDTIKTYETILNNLYKFQDFQQTLSIVTFNKVLVKLLQKLFSEERSCTVIDTEDFYNSFIKSKPQTYERFCPLYGIQITTDKLKLKSFTIYKTEYVKAKLVRKYKYVRDHPEVYLSGLDSDYLVGIKVIARDDLKAQELSESYFRTFENVLSYVVGDLNHMKCPGIFHYIPSKGISMIIHNGKAAISTSDILSINIPVDLNNESYKSIKNGNSKLWNLITKSSKVRTDLEERILSAVEWAGQGVRELDNSKALIHFVFAIEGLLKADLEGIITPSIISQIGDWLAFIIADDVINREKVTNIFKNIYRKRSAIAHGSSKNILRQDIVNAFFLCRQSILTLLTHKEFANIKTIKELDRWIIQQKFR